jgi:hypothetical protein
MMPMTMTTMMMMVTKRPRISGERPNDEEARDKYEYRKKAQDY